MSKYFKWHVFGFLVLLSLASYSQGCSDAGICSLGSLSIIRYKLEALKPIATTVPKIDVVDSTSLASTFKVPEKKDTNKQVAQNSTGAGSFIATEYISPKLFFQLITYYGIGENNTMITTFQLEGTVSIIKQKLFGQVKLPYTLVNGNLGSTHGLGDITLSLSYLALQHSNSTLSFSGGVKLPTNNADAFSSDNLPLPMIYQTSLGTTDVLLGVKYSYKKWDFTVGYQHPFNTNGNQYLPNPALEKIDEYNSYFVSNKLKRADDGIFRVNRVFTYKKLDITPGLLFIYHLAEDEVTDFFGNRVKVDGSSGLTLNANLAGSVSISNKFDVVFILGAPLVDRKSHPDGLARKLVTIIGIRYSIY